ncbi:uncharacterized protein LOC130384294 [Gadus chalcogrammus]|uniref:uncharacterized protein LOC130384294 n=1 Tax=Gadus chalcogrammus TaxID=1042646 RepID=UPI0024C28629|nr:uncharacterized protein LOC130384294 [Gadus chalcogrammus]
MPSSFCGLFGKIVYKLEAKLSKSWRLDSNVKQEINFASKAISNFSHLMTRQVGQVDKDIGIFSKRSVHMEVFVESGVYAPGQTVAVTVKVKNTSSKDVTPKFSLNQYVTYRAHGFTKFSCGEICKLVGEVIEKESEKTVTCALKIPPDTILSIQNCEILSVEYNFKVYLDISFATDPEINFPLVIAPSGSMLSPGPGGMNQPYPPVAYGGPSNSDNLPPAAGSQPAPHQQAYGPSAGTIGLLSDHRLRDHKPLSLWSLLGGFGRSAAFGPQAAFGSQAAFGPQAAFWPQAASMPPAASGPPAAWGPGPAAPGAVGAAYYQHVPQNKSPYGPPAQPSAHPPVLQGPPPPAAPGALPSAPTFDPGQYAPPSLASCYNGPTYSMPPQMPGMGTDFLSRQNEEPPSYLSMFPPVTNDKPPK